VVGVVDVVGAEFRCGDEADGANFERIVRIEDPARQAELHECLTHVGVAPAPEIVAVEESAEAIGSIVLLHGLELAPVPVAVVAAISTVASATPAVTIASATPIEGAGNTGRRRNNGNTGASTRKTQKASSVRSWRLLVDGLRLLVGGCWLFHDVCS
jgi:hypothetical protein